MRIDVCGTRGSTPAPGRDFVRYGGHTSCLAVRSDEAPGPELVLDAGTGIREVTGLLAGRPFQGTIALTHLHWDHMQGLPFFRAADTDGARVRLLLPEPEGSLGAEAALERARRIRKRRSSSPIRLSKAIPAILVSKAIHRTMCRDIHHSIPTGLIQLTMAMATHSIPRMAGNLHRHPEMAII